MDSKMMQETCEYFDETLQHLDAKLGLIMETQIEMLDALLAIQISFGEISATTQKAEDLRALLERAMRLKIVRQPTEQDEGAH
jgi:ribosomal protein L17